LFFRTVPDSNFAMIVNSGSVSQLAKLVVGIRTLSFGLYKVGAVLETVHKVKTCPTSRSSEFASLQAQLISPDRQFLALPAVVLPGMFYPGPNNVFIGLLTVLFIEGRSTYEPSIRVEFRILSFVVLILWILFRVISTVELGGCLPS
jgi:hypothetical protein